MTFADKLKQTRKNKGMSQAELARCIGVSRAAISRYESGERTQIAAPILLALCSSLNVTWQELVADTEIEQVTALSLENSYSKAYIGGNVFINGINAYDGLTFEETSMIQLFQKLNPEGQLRAIEYISDLTEHPKYKRGVE